MAPRHQHPVIAVDSANVAYMAVPKAACSTVKSLLAQIDPNVDLPEPGGDLHAFLHRTYPTVRFNPRHWDAKASHYRFTVIRDPLRRLLSVYTNRVVDLQELKNCANIRRGRVDLPTDPDPDYFFLNLDAYRKAASSIKHHSLPIWMFTGERLDHFDRVYRTDELPQLALDLGERAGKLPELMRENPSSARLAITDLGSKTRAALADHVARDYALLAGFYPNPL
ncbi:MAG: sulfotransferase family 2 domain-containing protein [Marinibacterium sp.]